MIFFDTNELFKNFGGSINSSSGTALAPFAFDEDRKFSWITSGQGTDGTAVYLERILPITTTINAIFIQSTNIENITIEVDLGAGYVALSAASSFTLIKSENGETYYYELDSSITIIKIKINGSDTITPNQEKRIAQVLGFVKLGQIKDFDDITPKRTRVQVVNKLITGKTDIINMGISWDFNVKLKSHYVESDGQIINDILERDKEVWIWFNDNLELIQEMSTEPFRFNDIYKVVFEKSDSTKYHDNMWFSGLDSTFKFKEVA